MPQSYSVTLEDGTTANVGKWVAKHKQKRKERIKDGNKTASLEEERLNDIGILWEVRKK